MHWSGDPFTGGRPKDATHRPHNGALLRGYVYKKSGVKWLKVVEISPRGKGSQFVNVEDGDKWIEFGETGGQQWLDGPL